MMSSIPSRLDHDLALEFCNSGNLTEAERVTCTLVALAAMVGEPVQPKTLAAFHVILSARAAS